MVSGSGDLPRDADALARPSVPVHVLTGDGVVRAADGLTRPPSAAVTPLSADQIVQAARALSGGGPVLCEGGPHLFGTLLDGAVPLELFLTVAPQLAGRSAQSPQRRSLVEGVALPPFSRPATLRSVRRAQEHLLLRYEIDAAVPGRHQGMMEGG